MFAFFGAMIGIFLVTGMVAAMRTSAMVPLFFLIAGLCLGGRW